MCLFDAYILFIFFRKGGDLMAILERKYQSKLIKKLKDMFPGCVILKNDANYLQGFPDLTFLYGKFWAILETKRSPDANKQANQEYYVEYLNNMSFSRFICPENEKEVLHDLEQALRSRR